MDISNLTLQQWLLAALAAFTVGLAKSGFGGVSMLTVAIMAAFIPGHERESTGLVLPLLICGDALAIGAFRRHVRWPLLVRMLPPSLVGIGLGFISIKHLSNAGFKPVIGGIVLVLVALQILRTVYAEKFQNVPHSRWFTWAVGIGAGVTTMLANAGGPMMTLYFLAVQLPKLEFVATAAWFFLIINLCKVPLILNLGLISHGSLLFNALLAPVVFLGVATGKPLLQRINQKFFERLLLGFTAATALHLILS